MELSDRYDGTSRPFEGDLVLPLTGLPEGAAVTSARVRITPVDRDGLTAADGAQFEEVFSFDSPAPGELAAADWGLDRDGVQLATEVDFRARRTLAGVEGSDLLNATLQVDLGGVFADVSDTGSLGGPTPFTLQDASSSALPGLATQKLRLTAPVTRPRVDKVRVESVPSNVSVAIERQGPFWTELGLVSTPRESPDFSDLLQAALAESPAADGFHTLELTVHTDSLARLIVEVDVAYEVAQPVVGAGASQARQVVFDAAALGADAEPLSITVPVGAAVAPAGATASIRGGFEPPRIAVGARAAPSAEPGLNVTGRSALAQAFELAADTEVTALDFAVGKVLPDPARVDLAIRADLAGRPSGEVLARRELRVENPLGGHGWHSARLDAPLRLEARAVDGSSRRYWLVLQSVEGEVEWRRAAAAVGTGPLQRSENGGLSWRDEPAPEGVAFRVREQPSDFRVPVSIQIGDGENAVHHSLDRLADRGRVDFAFDFGQSVQQALERKRAALPCRPGERLQNAALLDPVLDEIGPLVPGVPEGWEGIPGRVQRLPGLGAKVPVLLMAGGRPEEFSQAERECCFKCDEEIEAAFPDGPAELCQPFEVDPGCALRLRITYVPTATRCAPSDATAARCGLFASVPLELPQELLCDPSIPSWKLEWLDEEGAGVGVERGELTARRGDVLGAPVAEEVDVRAPEAARRARLCIVQPAPGLFGVLGASVAAVQDAVRNSRFDVVRDGTLAYWTPVGAVRESGNRLRLLPEDPDQDEGSRVTQPVAVEPGVRYELNVAAELLDGSGAAVASRVELEWRAGEETLGDPVVLSIRSGAFSVRRWSGVAPADADGAELRIVRPAGAAHVWVDSVHLEARREIELAIRFLSEAPGTLTVRELGVRHTEDREPLAPAPRQRPPPPPKGPTAINMILEVEVLEGVGPSTAASLRSEGHNTIEDIARLPDDAAVEGVHPDRLLTLQTNAQRIADLRVHTEAFGALAGESLQRIWELRPAEIAARSGQPLERAREFHFQIRQLRTLLKNDRVRQLTLGDLQPPAAGTVT